MAGLDFPEIAGLISRSQKTEIATDPHIKADGWALYQGHDNDRRSRTPFQVLYLGTRCKSGELDDARLAAERTDQSTEVVYAPSLNTRGYWQRAAEVWTHESWVDAVLNTREYLLSFLKTDLAKYQSELSKIKPTDYIQPRVRTPSGFIKKLPDPLESALVRDDREDEERTSAPRGIGVLLAEPGQGKTYTTQHLATKLLLKEKIIPLYINSTQWSTIRKHDMKSVSKILSHCFHHFSSPVNWMAGNETEFIRVTLKAGVFAVIFDGFDEYALWDKHAVYPQDTLDALNDIAAETGGRILVTSRTSFWHSSFAKSNPSGVDIFELLPFDAQHARNYFTARLSRPDDIDRAANIFRGLSKLDQGFSGRGFMLSLIADLATPPCPVGESEPDTLNWILRSLCDREIARRQLQLPTNAQISAFQELAFDTIRERELHTTEIEVAIGIAQPHFDPNQVADTVEKLKHHPLIQWNASEDSWQWKHEQIEIMLVGYGLCSYSSEPKRLKEFFDGVEPFTTPRRIDIADAVVSISLAVGGMGKRRVIQLARDILKTRTAEGSRTGTSIALRATDKLTSTTLREDRTKALLDVGGDTKTKKFCNLVIAGDMVSSMDFSDISFIDCSFERARWIRCKFNESTEFRNCEFRGGNYINCDGFGLSKFVDVRADQDAIGWIRSAQIREGKRRYSADDLDSDIKSVLSKFIGRSGHGMNTVAIRDLSQGSIKESKYRDQILNKIKTTLLDRHPTLAEYRVRGEAQQALQHYAEHNGFTGTIRDVRDGLKNKLKIS